MNLLITVQLTIALWQECVAADPVPFSFNDSQQSICKMMTIRMWVKFFLMGGKHAENYLACAVSL